MKRCAQCGTEHEDEALFCRADGTPLSAGVTAGGDPYIGQLLLGQFAVESVIGEGGMGTVYRAHQTGVDRKVALKVLRSDVASIPGVAARFTREARLASRIKNPHVAHVYLTGTLPDGNLALAMEYLEGRSLEQLLEELVALPVQRAVHILRQLAEAVAEAHDLGIVHRDLKPENVMLVRSGGDDDFVKVLDFGIAKQVVGSEAASLTGAGMTLGTPLYMSPEAAAGEEIGPAADVYALGVMLYRMLAGESPFKGESATALLVQHLQEEPPLLSTRPRAAGVPTSIEKLVHRCLAKKPAARPADGHALLAALEEAVASMGSVAAAPAAKDPAAESSAMGRSSSADTVPGVRRGRRRARTWLGGALFGAVVALAAAAFWPRGATTDEARVASLERRAVQAFDSGSFDGPGGAIALTELLLTLRDDHPAALDLRRRMLRQLLTEARDAEREGQLATAIERLEIAARLAPDDATLPDRRRRLEQQLHAGEPTTPPAPPEPSPAPDVVAGAASRAVRVVVEPEVPMVGQPVTLRALVRGFDRPLERAHFHVRAGARGMRFRAAVVDATRADDATYAASFAFPLPGRYIVGFASHAPGGRHVDEALQVRVVPATAPGGPIPPPAPEPAVDGGTTPPPEPPPPEPPPPPSPDAGTAPPPPVVEPPPPAPEPPAPPPATTTDPPSG